MTISAQRIVNSGDKGLELKILCFPLACDMLTGKLETLAAASFRGCLCFSFFLIEINGFYPVICFSKVYSVQDSGRGSIKAGS